jgi:uncharacterized DUF497 family protein
MKFVWDEDKAKTNKIKHNVSFEEAIEIFRDPNMLDNFDKQHSTLDEIRYNAIALSSKRLLFVVFTITLEQQEETIRIISARKAEKQEKELYEKENR